MQYKTHLVKPYTRLLKFILTPLLCLSALFVFMLLSGYRGRARSIEVPHIMGMEPEWITVATLMLVFSLIIFLLMLVLSLKDESENEFLILNDNALQLDTPALTMRLNVNKAERFLITMRPWYERLFFHKYYRIGKIVIHYEGDCYSFYFPVRNNGIEDDLKIYNSKKNK